MNSEFTVFLVDDDCGVRDSLSLLLGVNGYRTTVFSSAESFLSALNPSWLGCILADIRMPGMDGLSLQQHLKEIGNPLPMVIMTGHGDIDSARQAFRADAIDFLEKPINESRLICAIDEAFGALKISTEVAVRGADFRLRESTLTPREREVLQLVVIGKHNREIAEILGISVRTVEVHKARVMTKLQVNSLPDLVRQVLGHQPRSD